MHLQEDKPGVAILPPILFGIALLIAIALHWRFPLRLPGRDVTLTLGIVLLIAGVGLAVWGHDVMVRAGTNVNPLKPTTAIVTAGPFRYSRNPLYISLTLIFLGISFILGMAWGVVVLVPALLVLHFGVVLREERYLERKFGETYREYKRRVRRYV